MTTLTRTGYLVDTGPIQEIKKELTVRPIVNGDFGFPPPPFKVFRPTKNGVCVPRFYGPDKLGEPQQDKRPEPTRIKTKFVGELRDSTHQNEALAAAIKAGHGVLSLPCGYGKTTVSLAIACKLGYRTMIVVHKQFLADQWRERIQQFCPGATIGVVQQNKKEVDCDFVIAMLQSLSLKEYSFSDFESVGTLIVDELKCLVSPSSKCVHGIFMAFQQHQRGKMVSQRFFIGLWVPPFLQLNGKIRNRLKCSQSSLSLQTIEIHPHLCEMVRFQCPT